MSRKHDPLIDPVPYELDRIGIAARALLSESIRQLPSRVTDRLYEARLTALAARKVETVPFATPVTNKRFSLANGGHFSENPSAWARLGWMAPFLVLIFGLIAIADWQQESRINDIAAVDVALLTDDVPPDAYMDSGFLAFLKLSSHAKSELKTIDTEEAESAVSPS